VTLPLLGLLAFAALAALAYHRAQRRRALQRLEDSNWQWERLRHRLDELLSERSGSTLVLITGYGVPSEAAGHVLGVRLSERWPDKVEVVWEEIPHADPRWVVVTTSETTVATPLLGRQWLARMRTVCEWGGCAVAHFGVHWGGSPPTPASIQSQAL
jgi:hypothetical protein